LTCAIIKIGDCRDETFVFALPPLTPGKTGFLKNQKLNEMKIPRIKTPFEGMPDPAFETKSATIHSSMLANVVTYPSPVPALPQIQGELQDFSSLLLAAASKDKNAVNAKNDARKVLTLSLIQLSNYVSTTANGDRTKLALSGFDLAKPGEVVIIRKPEIIIVTDGPNAGELVVKVSRVKGAKAYGPQYTFDPLTDDSVWTKFMSSTSKYTFRNLPSGKKIWCRVCVMGGYGQQVYSDAVWRVVQ
jgi:hypothetical protein